VAVDADRDREGIHPRSLELDREATALVDRDPSEVSLDRRQLVEDGEAVPHRGLDGADDLEGKAHPILEGSAVLVAAPVVDGREELAEQVPVGSVELDVIETDALLVDSRLGHLLDTPLDLFLRHLPRIEREIEDPFGHRDVCRPGILTRRRRHARRHGEVSLVVNHRPGLQGDLAVRSDLVDRVGQRPQLLRSLQDPAPFGDVLGGDGSHATSRPGAIELDGIWAPEADGDHG
jgi:hypothetical protein